MHQHPSFPHTPSTLSLEYCNYCKNHFAVKCTIGVCINCCRTFTQRRLLDRYRTTHCSFNDDIQVGVVWVDTCVCVFVCVCVCVVSVCVCACVCVCGVQVCVLQLCLCVCVCLCVHKPPGHSPYLWFLQTYRILPCVFSQRVNSYLSVFVLD